MELFIVCNGLPRYFPSFDLPLLHRVILCPAIRHVHCSFLLLPYTVSDAALVIHSCHFTYRFLLGFVFHLPLLCDLSSSRGNGCMSNLQRQQRYYCFSLSLILKVSTVLMLLDVRRCLE